MCHYLDGRFIILLLFVHHDGEEEIISGIICSGCFSLLLLVVAISLTN